MSTDTTLLKKALFRLAIWLFFLILSPISLSIGFKALRIYKEGYKFWIGIGIITIAIMLTLFTIFFGFKTFKILSKSIFQK